MSKHKHHKHDKHEKHDHKHDKHEKHDHKHHEPVIVGPRDHTSPFIWCAAILCAIIAIIVIITGIIAFLGYVSIRPRVPQLSVTRANIDNFYFDQTSQLTVQVTIVIRFTNANAKARASFYNTRFQLRFRGQVIAILMADEFPVNPNSSVEHHYVVQSNPIPLNAAEAEEVNLGLRRNLIAFDLDGTTRTSWRVAFIRSVKFWLHLHCTLRLPVNRTPIFPRCTSRAT